MYATTRDDTPGCPSSRTSSASADQAKPRISCAAEEDGDGTSRRGVFGCRRVFEAGQGSLNVDICRAESARRALLYIIQSLGLEDFTSTSAIFLATMMGLNLWGLSRHLQCTALTTARRRSAAGGRRRLISGIVGEPVHPM
ncbi:hypothetical protein SCHPADRAFT_387414 [Schizopora paradoxa]|uniref:Uncharacterized protein n=1 Tax=Schizopora paradoxa TaxID=27342 RepID=A0A0H2RM02_9AGAM|nr:hypothetical protein SCHPADRAFT_387414 [Schizopora paradoxa]